jgi:hypothetical protein
MGVMVAGMEMPVVGGVFGWGLSIGLPSFHGRQSESDIGRADFASITLCCKLTPFVSVRQDKGHPMCDLVHSALRWITKSVTPTIAKLMLDQ